MASLDRYLARQALPDQAAGKSRTYVVTLHGVVVGHFALAAASVAPASATSRAKKGQGCQAIPAILIGRLGVDESVEGQGIGEALLVEALRRCSQAADTIGARVVLVNALDAHASDFYLRYGFEPSPIDANHLMMLIKDVRRSLSQ